tara:strand:- start:68 stop:2038 length:1971 start_codon:yes stop_codon:yes gene_type:complete
MSTFEQAFPDRDDGTSRILQGIPTGTSREDIRNLSIERGIATPEEWEQWAPELTPTSEKVMGWMKENAEVPAGLGGAAMGAVAGIPFGPVGIVAGSVFGGATGSASGSLLSDHLAGEDLDYGTAAWEAAISLGLDVSTLGLGKFAGKPLAAWFKQKKANGMSVQDTADLLVSQARAGKGAAGSEESLNATQSLLTQGGATLTPYQAGTATGWQVFQEKLGRLGFLGAKDFEQNAQQVNKVVNDGFMDIMGKQGDQALDPDGLGSSIHGLILAGKESLSKQYDVGLGKITATMAGRLAPLAPTRNVLEKFLKDNDNPIYGALEPTTEKMVNEVLTNMENLTSSSISAKTLIQFEKNFKTKIRSISNPQSPDFNDNAARQLEGLSSKFRDAVQQSLSVSDTAAAKAYGELNKQYAQGINTLLPVVNKNLMLGGNKGTFEGLGNALVGDGSLGATRALFDSIDEAFKQIGGSTIHFANAAEVKATVRQGYLKKIMKDIGQEGFDVNKYKTLALDMANPKKQARLAYIMGDKYKSVKQLINTMAESTTKPQSNIGELALRAREFGAVTAVGVVGYGTGAVAEAVMGAALIFTVPLFMAKAALNPKHVNKILAFEKTNFKGNKTAMATAMSNLVGDVMLDQTEEVRAEIMDSTNNTLFGVN